MFSTGYHSNLVQQEPLLMTQKTDFKLHQVSPLMIPFKEPAFIFSPFQI